MAFEWVPRETVEFLRGLEANNARDWFEAHRAEYERFWLKVGLDLAAELSWPVAKHGLYAEPKLNGSLRRIHRDVRFSSDKRPYEPRLHLILSVGPDFNKVPGVHLVIGPQGLGHGVGQWMFTPEQLGRLRVAFCDADQRAAFLGLVAKAEALGESFDPPDLARVPKGYAAEPDWAHLLQMKRLVIRTQADLPHPDWLFGPDCVRHLTRIAAELAPIARWLVPILAA